MLLIEVSNGWIMRSIVKENTRCDDDGRPVMDRIFRCVLLRRSEMPTVAGKTEEQCNRKTCLTNIEFHESTNAFAILFDLSWRIRCTRCAAACALDVSFCCVLPLPAIEPWNRAGYSNLLFATGAKDKGERSGLVRGVLVALLTAAVSLLSAVSFQFISSTSCVRVGETFQLPL